MPGIARSSTVSDSTEATRRSETAPALPGAGSETDRCRIVSESAVDYKYRRIVEQLPVEFVCQRFTQIVGDLLGPGARLPDVFHIRYLKWRGYIGTALRYTLLVGLCKLRGVRIVFSCHNIRSYSIPSERYDTLLRRTLFRAADSIVVFDEALRPFLRSWSDKVVVACFGEFRSKYRRVEEGREGGGFLRRYRRWSQGIDWASPRLLFVGAYAPSKHVETLLEIGRRNADLAVIAIAPGMESEPGVSSNVFLHTDWVGVELEEILQEPNLLGFVGHANISVPTSIYLFASYGIPIIALDHPPVGQIVGNHQLGTVIDAIEDVGEIVRGVLADREHHRDALERFLESHSWAASAAAHRKAFGIG